jgi:orotidine-5'-phosphate decarboxylase
MGAVRPFLPGVLVALDLDGREEALEVVAALGDGAAGFKVGSQLFGRTGPEVVDRIRQAGGKVFLDLKFHDIPNTVGKAVEAAVARGVTWLTVHASGGSSMVRAAAAAAGEAAVLAVTVLTSLSPGEAGQVGIPVPLQDQVLRLAETALAAGAHGVVCGPREVGGLRRVLGEGFLAVTPGIRPSRFLPDDQARASTAAQAVEDGADYLVVGRPILAAPDRRAAMEAILGEMRSAQRRR